MRAVRNDENGIHVVELPDPEGDGALVEIASCGICGTDLGYLAMGPLSFTLGHEFAGFVDGVPYAVEPQMRRLHANRRAIAEAEAANHGDRLALLDLQRGGDADARRHDLLRQHARADGEAQRRHFVGEAGETTRAGDDGGAAHEGAAAMLAPKQTERLEIAQGVANRDAADVIGLAELLFRQDLIAWLPMAKENFVP